MKDFYFNPDGAYRGWAGPAEITHPYTLENIDEWKTYSPELIQEIWHSEPGEHPLDDSYELFGHLMDNKWDLPNVLEAIKRQHRRYPGVFRGGSHYGQFPRPFNDMRIGINLSESPHDFDDAVDFINEMIEHEEIHRGTVPDLKREGLRYGDPAYERIVHELMEAAR